MIRQCPAAPRPVTSPAARRRPSQGRQVTILHRLPGRIRMRLAPAPRDADRLTASIGGHEGIDLVRYAAPTSSVLVRYRTDQVQAEELVLRVALAHSFDGDTVPVRILTEPERTEMTGSALAAGALLLAAGAVRVARAAPGGPSPLDWVAGAGTTLAVVDHAWREMNEQGYYDPEVLSLGYLVAALARGNVLKPAFFTWLATFGRHLAEAPHEGVTVRPVDRGPDGDGAPQYEVEVGREESTTTRARFLRLLRSFAEPRRGGSRTYGRRSLVDEMLDVSRRHGRVLDGMDGMPAGIPLRFHEEVF